jgi:hypothetical protein
MLYFVARGRCARAFDCSDGTAVHETITVQVSAADCAIPWPSSAGNERQGNGGQAGEDTAGHARSVDVRLHANAVGTDAYYGADGISTETFYSGGISGTGSDGSRSETQLSSLRAVKIEITQSKGALTVVRGCPYNCGLS